jgi:hypothetical protein
MVALRQRLCGTHVTENEKQVHQDYCSKSVLTTGVNVGMSRKKIWMMHLLTFTV